MSNPALNFSMFTASKQTAIDNASLAFGKPLGSKFDLGYDDTTYGSRGLGIAAFRSMLTVGDTANGFDAPINRAGRSLYTKYWEKNSSISKFQPQDIIIYTYGSAQCVALLSWLVNIYGVRKVYNPNTTYNRDALWTALGVDAADIGKHLTDLRGYINNKIIDLKNVRLDADVPLYLYCDNMYKHIYMDAPCSSKTQYYVVRPGAVLKYVRTGENIGSLQYDRTIDGDSVNLTYAQITAFVDTIWSAFFNSAYIADISAAIGKAGVKLWSIAEVTESYATQPAFDARALIRYKNASVRTMNWEQSDNSITQDVLNQTIKCKLSAHNIDSSVITDVSTVKGLLVGGQFLHSFSEKTQTPEETIVTGSLMTNGVYKEDTGSVELHQYGFEILEDLELYTRDASGALGHASVGPYYIADVISLDDELPKALRMATFTKEFDFIPTMRFAVGEGGTFSNIATIVDTDDYVVVWADDLYKLHRTAIYAILGVPAE